MVEKMDSYSSTVRYKMVLFGSESVGKTSLVERYINDKFQTEYISTLGYNVYEKQIPYKEGDKEPILISLMLFDIGGQEKFRQIRQKYAEGANLAFILFDITNRASFEKIAEWKKDLFEFAGEIPFMILGNKVDLADERQVTKEELQNLASQLGAIDFIETSAKTGLGVDEAFMKLSIETLKKTNL